MAESVKPLNGRPLKTVVWTKKCAIDTNVNYYNAYGFYRLQNTTISTFTGYDSNIWNKRVFAFVSRSYGADGSIPLPAFIRWNVSGEIFGSNPKAADITVEVTVLYYND